MEVSPKTLTVSLRDQDLLEPAAADVVRVLVDRHARDVFKLAYRITGNATDAEDAVQETFLKVFQKIESFEHRSELSTWIYRITVNAAIDLVRRRRRLEKRSAPLEDAAVRSSSPSQEQRVFGRQLEDTLTRAMSKLSEIERAAFVLRHFEQRTTSEISEALGLTRTASKHAVFRAVKKLRKNLEPFQSVQPTIRPT